MVFNELLNGISSLILAPIEHPEMFWTLGPLATVILAMAFYFGRYPHEEEGWNTIVANTIVVFYASLDLVRHTILTQNEANPNSLTVRLVLVMTIAIIAMIFLVMDFSHFFPKKIAKVVSGLVPAHAAALSMIMIVYSKIKLDVIGVVAVITYLFLVVIFLKFIQFITPNSKQDEETAHIQEIEKKISEDPRKEFVEDSSGVIRDLEAEKVEHHAVAVLPKEWAGKRFTAILNPESEKRAFIKKILKKHS